MTNISDDDSQYYNYYPYNIYKCLTDNLTILTKIQSNNYYTMNEEINRLKSQNNLLNLSLTSEKRKLAELTNIDDENENENKRLKLNKYSVKTYKKNNESYDENKINTIFNGLKTLKDIINLKKYWKNIKHNYKLQKLYHLIPALEKLEVMIGLNNVKTNLFKIIIYYIQHGYTDEYLHTVIHGPPGVGKTEFAKIYADIFVRLGILNTEKFIEIKKDDLVAEYLGQTSHRTKKVLENAMGGVIFLDEAYSLGNSEKRDSFAKEAIDMINQYLSERKKDFMFIIAGYEEELDACFFSFNRGLKRRFSHYFKIDKYSDKELMEIFKLKIKQKLYEIDISDDKLLNFFKDKYSMFENYAGDVEKLVNFIKYEQNIRCFRNNISNRKIILEDLIESFKFIKTKEKKDKRPPFGMYS